MSLRSLLRSVVEWIRPPRRVEPELRITPQQLRAALSEMLSDPETRRLVLRGFVGTLFPVSGGQCTSANVIQGGAGDAGTFGKPSCGPRVYTFESDAVGNIPLSVKGFSGQTADLQQWKDSNNAVLAVVASDGKLGVGTTSPTQKLEVVNSPGSTTRTIFARGGVNPHVAAQSLSSPVTIAKLQALDSGLVFVGAESSHRLGLITNNTERLSIDPFGKVGIGTTSPGARLDVQADGNIGANWQNAQVRIAGLSNPNHQLNMGYDTTNNLGVIQPGEAGVAFRHLALNPNGGNVGIGLTNPSEKLRVAGKVYVEQRLGFVTAGSPDGAAELYREETPPADPSKNIILRSFANKPQTLLALLAPPGNINTPTKINLEATIALSRGDGDNKEFLDLYNNGYEDPVSPPPNIQYGIRIQRRGSGQSAGKYRDFVFDQSDGGSEKLPLMILKASRSVGIGIEDRLSQLTVKGRASFQATGTVTVNLATPTTVTGDAGPPLTLFTQEVGLGDKITIEAETKKVVAIGSDNSITVDSNFNSAHTNKAMTVIKSLSRIDDSSGSVKVIVSDEGKVGIGTITPGNILTVVQNSATDPIADAWTTFSSRRWKTNVRSLEGALEKVERLRGVFYDRKEDGKRQIGLVGEEVGEVVPEVVTFEQNGEDARSVDYARLTALLIEAVKEQQEQIREVRRQVEAAKTGAAKGSGKTNTIQGSSILIAPADPQEQES